MRLSIGTAAGIALLLQACAEPRVARSEPAPQPPSPSAVQAPPNASAASAPAPAPEAPPWAGGVEAASNAGTYRVVYRPVGGAIVRGQPFALDLWVLDAHGEHALADVDVAVDAAMPEHEHGMNREPRVAAEGGGRFLAEGLLFHMAGRWELYVDVARGPRTERAQFEVRLE